MDTTISSIVELEEPDYSSGYEDLERLGVIATAAALIAYGVTRRTLPGFCLAAAAAPVLYRGLAGDWPAPLRSLPRLREDDTRVALAGSRGIHVRESIRIEKPVAEVYAFWRRFENLPRFMRNLERVIALGDNRSHWVAKGPAGRSVEWDAEIINEVPNEVIGWRSLPGADVVTAGSVNFRSVRLGAGTQLAVHLQYAPPAGRWGAFMAKLAGREPSQTIREDLRRLKQILEAGEIARATADDE